MATAKHCKGDLIGSICPTSDLLSGVEVKSWYACHASVMEPFLNHVEHLASSRRSQISCAVHMALHLVGSWHTSFQVTPHYLYNIAWLLFMYVQHAATRMCFNKYQDHVLWLLNSVEIFENSIIDLNANIEHSRASELTTKVLFQSVCLSWPSSLWHRMVLLVWWWSKLKIDPSVWTDPYTEQHIKDVIVLAHCHFYDYWCMQDSADWKPSTNHLIMPLIVAEMKFTPRSILKVIPSKYSWTPLQCSIHASGCRRSICAHIIATVCIDPAWPLFTSYLEQNCALILIGDTTSPNFNIAAGTLVGFLHAILQDLSVCSAESMRVSWDLTWRCLKIRWHHLVFWRLNFR